MTLYLALLLQASPWEPIPLPEAAAGRTLRGVAAAGEAVWIVGDRGLCLRSPDGGRRWAVRSLGTAATLRSIRFFDAKLGVVTGDGDPDAPKPTGHIVMGRAMKSGTVLWTLDGGETWKKAHPPTNFEILCAEARSGPFQFGNSGGDLHPDGDVLRGAAAPDDWDGKGYQARRCYRALFDIRAVDAKRWVAVGSPVSVGFTPPPKDALYAAQACRALVSRDGGETWAPSKGSEGPGALRGLAVGASRLLAVGDAGALLASDDRGESWTAAGGVGNRGLTAVVSTERASVAVGEEETALVSADGGRSWKRISAGKDAFLALAAVGDDILAVGERGLARKASTPALLAAKAVEVPAAPAKPEPKGPTGAQRKRVMPGSAAVYRVVLDAPAMKLKLDFQREEKITALSEKDFTVDATVLKGTPPPGTPAKGEVKLPFSMLEDLGELKVGETQTENDKTGRATRTRRENETLKIGERSLDCYVVEGVLQTADGGMTMRQKSWFAKGAEVPGLGLVKEELVQEMAGPQGPIRVTQVTTLLSWTLAEP